MSLDVTFVYTFLVVLVAALYLRSALFQPVSRLLDERAGKLKADADARKEALASREAKILEYNGRLQAARRAAYEAREAARKSSLEARSEILASARAGAEKEAERGRREIAEAAARVRERLSQESQGLAVAIAARILGRPVTSV